MTQLSELEGAFLRAALSWIGQVRDVNSINTLALNWLYNRNITASIIREYRQTK